MRIDCTNMSCPQPVIETKNALEKIQIGGVLEVVVNSDIVKQNVLKFFKFNNLEPSISQEGANTVISATKTSQISGLFSSDDYSCDIDTDNAKIKKVIYLNSDKAGNGEVGASLLSKLLLSFVQLSDNIEAIVLVNEAVKISTSRANPSYEPLKHLEASGVRVLSCGACLQSYGLVDKLSIGEITNALEIAELLIKFGEIKL